MCCTCFDLCLNTHVFFPYKLHLRSKKGKAVKLLLFLLIPCLSVSPDQAVYSFALQDYSRGQRWAVGRFLCLMTLCVMLTPHSASLSRWQRRGGAEVKGRAEDVRHCRLLVNGRINTVVGLLLGFLIRLVWFALDLWISECWPNTVVKVLSVYF